jgi:hypothetical protein
VSAALVLVDVRDAEDATVVVLDGDVELTSWPLRGSAHPDLATVDELAGLQLALRRAGCVLRLRQAGADLLGLLDLVGLSVEVSGQSEDREEGGVEEVVVADDPVARDLDDLDGPR